MRPAEDAAVAEDPIRRRRLYEEVEARLTRDLREGIFKVGDFLPPERALMERFGVGRPAVREALFSLQKKGLLHLSSGERPKVTAPTAERMVRELAAAAQHFLTQPDGIAQFQRAREFLEVGLARAAAQTATADDIAMLKEKLDENKRAIGDPNAFAKTDVEFHHILATMQRNTIITALAEAVSGWLTEQRSKVLQKPEADRAAFRFHRRIFLAVKLGDATGAEAAMREHLSDVNRRYWNSMK